jgi:hypothetical protein
MEARGKAARKEDCGVGGGSEMDDQTIGSESAHVQEDMLKMAAPLQSAWHNACFDLPLAMLSEAIRFAGQRLQAQGEFLASLKTCRTVPEVLEAQSAFVRTAVDDYGAETSKIMEDVRTSVSKPA